MTRGNDITGRDSYLISEAIGIASCIADSCICPNLGRDEAFDAATEMLDDNEQRGTAVALWIAIQHLHACGIHWSTENDMKAILHARFPGFVKALTAVVPEAKALLTDEKRLTEAELARALRG